MNEGSRSWRLVAADVVLLYTSLAIALFLRGGKDFFWDEWPQHFVPFSILIGIWIIVFFILDLYSLYRWRSRTELVYRLCTAVLINIAFTIAFFYVVGSFDISPKTNLALFAGCFLVLGLCWRILEQRHVRDSMRQHVAFFALGENESSLFHDFCSRNSEIYTLSGRVADDRAQLDSLLSSQHVDLIVTGDRAFHAHVDYWYKLALAGYTVLDSPHFWERIHRRVPLSAHSISHTLHTIQTVDKREFDRVKRIVDLALCLLVFLLIWWLILIIPVAIALSSRGPIFYRQIRVGLNGKRFSLIKFRTMIPEAEVDGPRWSTLNDTRVTSVGAILRHMHLDELPQLWNIFRGDMSFVGPRPERPVFVHQLTRSVPFYQARHFARPGITGWAQINYPYGASVEDASMKHMYDLYYLSHRSAFLDLKILLKTITMFVRGEGR